MENNTIQINFELYPFNTPQEYTNGTEYLSCFYSNLFMFLKACGNKNIDKYIANNIFYYGYRPEKTDLRYKYEVQYFPYKNVHTLYKESGIEILEKCIEPNEVMKHIINSLINNTPIMVNMDLYFLSYRPDRFMKVHTNHYAMIYGYNHKMKKLYIIDNPDNKKYYKCIMDQNDFIQAFKSAYNPNVNNLFQYINIGNESNNYTLDKCKGIFLNNIKKCYTDIYQSIGNIDRLIDEFTYITQDKDTWDQYKENLFYLMHYHILNKKKSQLYAFYHLLGNSLYVVALKDIVNLWEEVRNICSYYYMQRKYKKESIYKGIENMRLIKKLEEKFWKKFREYIG
ncbi:MULTISPECIES: BtrH N-terminal domain-containing protein [Blautia]|uniref:BtrH N-terminal domain-containing protein n=1 Tax=Blautia TaxID=572511 RepID=UPI000BA4568B|nr:MULTISPECIES: BtrH N-terminal domain-containing protein [Blautia]